MRRLSPVSGCYGSRVFCSTKDEAGEKQGPKVLSYETHAVILNLGKPLIGEGNDNYQENRQTHSYYNKNNHDPGWNNHSENRYL